MKKILIIMLCVSLLTGCSLINLKKYYKNMQIDDNLESYQLDLRIYGNINNEKINKTIKIDNYKNKDFKIETNNLEFVYKNNKLYENINKHEIDFENMTPEQIEQELNNMNGMFDKPVYKESHKTIFKDTDLFLQGLSNMKSVKKIDNNIKGKDLKAYKAKVKKSYIENLLNELNLDSNYEEATAKLYLDNDKVFKIIYEIDELTISASYFRLNGLKELNI